MDKADKAAIEHALREWLKTDVSVSAPVWHQFMHTIHRGWDSQGRRVYVTARGGRTHRAGKAANSWRAYARDHGFEFHSTRA